MTAQNLTQQIAPIWRIEAGRPIAGLARLVRGIGLAEGLAPDALVLSRAAACAAEGAP